MSSQLETMIGAVSADLRALGRRFALVGGLAVSARTEPRFTRDLDLVVSVDDDAAAEQLVRDLTARGYEMLALVEQEATGRLATIRLATGREEVEGPVVDLLFASSGIEREVIDAAEDVEVFPGLRLAVASLATGSRSSTRATTTAMARASSSSCSSATTTTASCCSPITSAPARASGGTTTEGQLRRREVAAAPL